MSDLNKKPALKYNDDMDIIETMLKTNLAVINDNKAMDYAIGYR